MRFMFVKLAVLAAAMTPMPAMADLKATYRLAATSGQPGAMTVEASGSGASRIEYTGQAAAMPVTITSPGGETIVILQLRDQRVIARVEDFVALMDEAMSRLLPGGFQLPPELSQISLQEQGSTTVGRWSGTRYLLKLPGAKGSVAQQIELVLSDDPALAPIARASAQAYAAMANSSLFGRVLPPAFRQMMELSRTRVMLRGGTEIELTGIDNSAIDSTRFEVPGPVLARDQLRELMVRILGPMPHGGDRIAKQPVAVPARLPRQ